MLPVTGSCPAALDFHAEEVSSLCRPSRVNQANLRESLVNISPQMFSQLWLFHWIWALWLVPSCNSLPETSFLLGLVVCRLPPTTIRPCVKAVGIPSHHPCFPSFCFPRLEGAVIHSSRFLVAHDVAVSILCQ